MPERVDTHLLHHRETDPKGSDFRRIRYAEEREVVVQRLMDGHTKWIVGVVGAGIISLLSVLALRDRQAVDQTLVHLDGRIRLEEQTSARHEAELQVIKAKQERVLTDLVEIRKALDANSNKLDRVLIEVRRAR